MHVNIEAQVSYSEITSRTYFEVKTWVFEDSKLVGKATLFTTERYEQQPTEDMNLNLWSVALLRGLVASMENTFVYVDDRPPAVLIKNAIENKQK